MKSVWKMLMVHLSGTCIPEAWTVEKFKLKYIKLNVNRFLHLEYRNFFTFSLGNDNSKQHLTRLILNYLIFSTRTFLL